MRYFAVQIEVTLQDGTIVHHLYCLDVALVIMQLCKNEKVDLGSATEPIFVAQDVDLHSKTGNAFYQILVAISLPNNAVLLVVAFRNEHFLGS